MHTDHELTSEFPNHVEKIHELKISNAHFANLNKQYHEVGNKIHRIEIEVERASDYYLEDLKKERLVLLDEISLMLHG